MRCLSFIAVLFIAPQAMAQFSVTFSDLNDLATITVSPRPGIPIVGLAGAPYSGLQTNERTVTAADGTHLTQKSSSTRYWRDTEGRVRRDQEYPVRGTDLPPAHLVDIFDPLAGFDYVLDDAAGIVHRVKVQSRQHRNPVNLVELPPQPPRIEARPDGTKVKTEFLLQRTIAGLSASGVRTTTEYPIGSRMGNDRVVETSTEIWSSFQLGISLISRSSDPRGESVIELRDVVLGEPDPALMRLLPGYRIVDETGPFEIVVPKR